jgi:hypothetical protein
MIRRMEARISSIVGSGAAACSDIGRILTENLFSGSGYARSALPAISPF